MEKIRTVVRIAGKDYPITGYDTEDYVRRVALYVDRKIQELGMTARRSVQDCAVLTAVTIADELLKSQDENNRLRKELMEAHQRIDEMNKSGENAK